MALCERAWVGRPVGGRCCRGGRPAAPSMSLAERTGGVLRRWGSTLLSLLAAVGQVFGPGIPWCPSTIRWEQVGSLLVFAAVEVAVCWCLFVPTGVRSLHDGLFSAGSSRGVLGWQWRSWLARLSAAFGSGGGFLALALATTGGSLVLVRVGGPLLGSSWLWCPCSWFPVAGSWWRWWVRLVPVIVVLWLAVAIRWLAVFGAPFTPPLVALVLVVFCRQWGGTPISL